MIGNLRSIYPNNIKLVLVFLLIGIGILTAIEPFYTIIVLLGVLIAVLLLLNPHWLVYFFVVSFPFISLIPRDRYIPLIKLDELLIILCFIALSIGPYKKRSLHITKIDILFWGLILAGSALPTMGHLLRDWETEWLEAIALVKGYIIYRLVLQTINNPKQQKIIVYLLLLPFSLVLVIALLQMLNIGSTRALLAELYAGSGIYVQIADTTARYFRATSTLGNWNALGSYAAIGALLSLALIIHAYQQMNKYLLILTFASCIGLMILSGSSSSIVGFMIGSIVLWFYNSKKINIPRLLIYLTPVILAVIVVFVMAGKQVLQIQIERQTSAQSLYFSPSGEYVSTHGLPASLAIRGYLAIHLLEIMKADGIALLTGFGDGQNTRDLIEWGTAESGYISMIFYYGPLFILFYVLLLRQIFISSRKLNRQISLENKLGKGLTTASMCAVSAMLVMNIVSSYYSAAGTNHIFWILIACTMAIPKTDGYSIRPITLIYK